MPDSNSTNQGQSRLLGWLGWSSMDAIGRLLLMTGSTIILSRILQPQDFGVAAMILIIVAFAGVFVGAPFEDALTQRRVVRMHQFRAALGASWVIAVLLLLLSVAVGYVLAASYGKTEFQYLLPIATLSIFFSGHSDILTALARRLRRFNDVAYATLVGHSIGISAALVLAFMGYGVWALIAQRLLVVVSRAILLQWRIKFLILPGWSLPEVRKLARYAGISFMSRLIDNFTYLVFNALVQALYGFTTLGHVNMAMRLIEPIRGAIMGTSHNLAFSYFARACGNAVRFKDLMELIISRSAFVIAPVFAGMAAIAPVLLPMVTGEGWDDAIMITVCLAIASAMAVPANLVYTASSANGKPGYSLLSLVIGLCTIILVLIGCSVLGPIAVGLSRIAGDFVRALVAICIPAEVLHVSAKDRLTMLMPAWMVAGAMAMVVASLNILLPQMVAAYKLMLLSGCGIVIYAILLRIFARPLWDEVAARLHKPRLAVAEG